jgi:hypothetical protein
MDMTSGIHQWELATDEIRRRSQMNQSRQPFVEPWWHRCDRRGLRVRLRRSSRPRTCPATISRSGWSLDPVAMKVEAALARRHRVHSPSFGMPLSTSARVIEQRSVNRASPASGQATILVAGAAGDASPR